MMRRFAFLLAIFAALSVGMVPVADSVAKVEAAIAAALQGHHDRAAGPHSDQHAASPSFDQHAASPQDHDCTTADCAEHGVKPHPGHCPACTALPAGFVAQMAEPATGSPAVSGAERLFATFVPVDLPPPRMFHA